MKPQLHISSINQMSRCGVAFEFSQVKKIRGRSSPNLMAGSAVHESIAFNLTSVRDNGKMADEDQVIGIAGDWVDQAWADSDGVQLSADEQWEGESNVRARTVRKAETLAQLHYRFVAPRITPIQIERPFVLEFEGYDWEIAGTIDIQEPGRVRDTKTSGKSPSKMAAEDSTQLTCYALAVKALDGEMPGEMTLDYLIDLKRESKFLSLTTKREEQDLPSFFNRAQRAFEVYQSGAFMPAREDDWFCSDRYCSYHSLCPYVRHPVTVAVGGVI